MAISTDGPAHVGCALKKVAASREASRLPGSWESRIMASCAQWATSRNYATRKMGMRWYVRLWPEKPGTAWL